MGNESEVPAVSRHKCLIYEGQPSEQIPVVVPLLLEALREDRRCVYLGEAWLLEAVEKALEERGVDVARERSRGALVMSSARAETAGGFDPDAMIAMLRGLVDDAVRDGFRGLWATGDMRWELGEDRSFERLREYEAKLELLFRDKPLSGVCQYHVETIPDAALRDALQTHRSVLDVGGLGRDNLFYLPPELLFKDGAGRDEAADWMWRQLQRVIRAEEQRDAAFRELERLNADLERKVKERTSDLEAFTFCVSHDLKAPVRHIGSFAALLARQASRLDEEGRGLLDRVTAGAERMSGLIDALLRFYQITTCALNIELVDLSRQAAALIESMKAAEPHRRVDIRIQPGLRARGDAGLLSSVLSNLFDNAWKFTRVKTPAAIEFGAEPAEDGNVFFVRDNGIGFQAKDGARLFKGFHRLHGSDYPGHGIGLASAHRILERHGGRIWAESRPGSGSTFRFTVPDRR